MRHLRAFLGLVFLSCSPASSLEPALSFDLGSTFPLRAGQQVQLEDGSLRLTFDEVLDDSRCPAAVVCVWEGNARVRITLTAQGADRQSVELNTRLEPKAASAFGYLVELVRVEPDPRPRGDVARDAYTVQIRVTRPS